MYYECKTSTMARCVTCHGLVQDIHTCTYSAYSNNFRAEQILTVFPI